MHDSDLHGALYRDYLPHADRHVNRAPPIFRNAIQIEMHGEKAWIVIVLAHWT
jgi:hypothetical protein